MDNLDENIEVEELVKHLEDREWRLNNLYYIKDESGKKVLFQMNEVQRDIQKNLWFFNIIPKARQLGVTTFFAILYFDQILFSENKTAGIIAHRQEDMKKIFKNKIRFAWDNLHPWLKAKIGEPNAESAYELSWPAPHGGSIFVSMSTRSGTVQFLHISEFGYICQKFPDKAEEIVTGAINSVHQGQFVSIESTAAGREGYFYDFAMAAERRRKEGRELTPLDFKIFFYPWFIDQRYILQGEVVFTKEDNEYFKQLEYQHGIKLSREQKNWYVKKKELNGDKMFSEFPSTLEEAFSVSTEGSFYATEMNRLYLTRRVQKIVHNPMYPVDTWWDIGMNDDTVILFVQEIDGQIRFIDMYVHRGEGFPHYVGVMEEKKRANGWRYGRHKFPHDLAVKEMNTGNSRKQSLWDLGLRDMDIAPKISIQDGISKVRMNFPRFIIDETNCAPLADALQNYRREFDDKLGTYKDKPRHDKNSHICDTVRVGCILYRELAILGGEALGVESTEQAFFS